MYFGKFLISYISVGGVLSYPARLFEFMSYFIGSNSVSAKCSIGAGTKLYHRGVGCVIHPRTKIGSNCVLFQNVTIGSKWSDGVCEHSAPEIGDNVLIGAGAVILGSIKIGNNVVIGANAVIISDIPDNCTVVGIPGKITKGSDLDKNS